MELNPQNNSQDAAPFGNVPQASESFRTVPNASEPFRTVRNDSESFRSVPHLSERKENHTLTVREAARMFEAAGVTRTERSITNWCQIPAQGIARLDAYFDPNERKYFITPQSVESAIAEEKAKAAKANTPSEPVGNVPQTSERASERRTPLSEDDKERLGELEELEKELMDLKITNRGKDFFIEQLQKEREQFSIERQTYVQQLMSYTHKVGELETRLFQIESPEPRRLKVSRLDETSEKTDFKSSPQDQPA